VVVFFFFGIHFCAPQGAWPHVALPREYMTVDELLSKICVMTIPRYSPVARGPLVYDILCCERDEHGVGVPGKRLGFGGSCCARVPGRIFRADARVTTSLRGLVRVLVAGI